MPVLTEPPSMGDVLKYEVNPNYTREVITLSHFTSGGELERQFSVWEGDVVAMPEGSEIEWTPTDITPSADGTLVRFWFVARDGRGGLTFTTRAACVVP